MKKPKLPKFNMGNLDWKSIMSKTGNGAMKLAKGAMEKGRTVELGDVKGFNPLKSVGAQLFALFFVCILVCVLTVGLLSYNSSRNIIEDKVADASLQTITQSSEKLDLIFGQFESLSLQLFLDPEVKAAVKQMRDDSINTFDKLTATRKLEEKVTAYVFSNNAIASIHLIPIQEGTPGYSTVGSFPAGLQKQPWFETVMSADGKAVWLETRKNGYVGTHSSPNFAIARVYKDTVSGTRELVLMMEIRLDKLRKELESVNLGEGSSIIMVSDKNKTILHKDNAEIEKDINLALKPDKESEPGKSVLGSTLRVYTVSPITNWTLVGQIPVNELVKEARSIFNLTLIIALIASILAVVIGIMVARHIGHPLVQLKSLMQQGEQGDLTVRTSFNRKDEIGLVGESFNQMMDKITVLLVRTSETAQSVLMTAGELSDASKKTASSAREIAVATEEIAGGATSLATEAERGMDLTSMIADRMVRVVNANEQMAKSSHEVQQSSARGTSYMSELTVKTNQTEEMTRSMVEKVDKLKESTQSIRKILDVLNNMTKQTNILSLNATIEAARAGAAGRGFMVVADEIRKLADQSKQSIEVVGQITEKIQSEIDETVQVLTTAYPMFQAQIQSVKDANEIFHQVENRMSGLVGQLDDVTGSITDLEKSQKVLTDAMSNVSAVAEESSATSEEVASLSTEQLTISEGLVRLSEKLEEVSVSLRESLSKFKVS